MKLVGSLWPLVRGITEALAMLAAVIVLGIWVEPSRGDFAFFFTFLAALTAFATLLGPRLRGLLALAIALIPFDFELRCRGGPHWWLHDGPFCSPGGFAIDVGGILLACILGAGLRALWRWHWDRDESNRPPAATRL